MGDSSRCHAVCAVVATLVSCLMAPGAAGASPGVAFEHPGALYRKDRYELVKARIARRQEPWLSVTLGEL